MKRAVVGLKARCVIVRDWEVGEAERRTRDLGRQDGRYSEGQSGCSRKGLKGRAAGEG